MKIVYSICCGIDVHKKFLVATIVSAINSPVLSYKKQRFSTFNNELFHLKHWLLQNGCHDVCMESTGKYWIPVFNILETDLHVVIVNPKWVKSIKGNKDDVKDSKWIGELFCFGMVRRSFIPEKPIRILREFTRYRSKLVAQKSSEKNRFQNGFTVCNIALDSVVSDMFGKSASAITNYLLTEKHPSTQVCITFLQRSLKKKADTVVAAIDGFQLTEEQKWRMLQIRNHMDYLVSAIDQLDERLAQLAKPYEAAIRLLCTIPGVKRESAITIISEIGADMSQFTSSKSLCCWAGLTPSSNESAGKKKSVKITRAGIYLKPALAQVAHAAVKCLTQPYYKIKYERIMKRRGKKRAIIAIARMILTAIYHMFQTGEMFNPVDLAKIDIPREMRERHKHTAIADAVKLLKKQGLLPETFSTEICT